MSDNRELKPIDEAQKEAEAFFKRKDVQAIFKEAFTLATVSLPNYQLNQAEWHSMYSELYPSKQKRDELAAKEEKKVKETEGDDLAGSKSLMTPMPEIKVD